MLHDRVVHFNVGEEFDSCREILSKDSKFYPVPFSLKMLHTRVGRSRIDGPHDRNLAYAVWRRDGRAWQEHEGKLTQTASDR